VSLLCMEEVDRLQPLLRTSNSCGERRTFKPNFLRLFHYLGITFIRRNVQRKEFWLSQI
jgi:hypothetical protein